jgi:4-hydroxymandelate oxidase
VAVNIADLERRARELLAPEIYDYYAGGSGQERTLRASEQAWQRYWLAPRVLRDVSAVETSVRLPVPPHAVLRTPVAVAPTGFQGLAHPDGEVATATGAGQAGALMVLSTRSSRKIEEVAAAVAGEGGTWWFQVYVMRDRSLTARLAERAVSAGAQALVLTGDTPVVGRKRRDRGADVITDTEFLVNLGPLADLSAAEQAADLTFADIGWLARLSGVPVLVKGVLRADDARACVAAGADGVIVSNHGGRQLDGAMPAALALPTVAEALSGSDIARTDGDITGTRGETGRTGGDVFADGGLRTGETVLTALALGAQAVFLGRPALWALVCGGAAGVRDLLTEITNDLAHAMALAGARSVADIPGVTAPATGNSLDM